MLFHKKAGSALLISLVILTLITIMSTVFFEKLFRFSDSSEGIENSNIAYYRALGMIEMALYTGGVNKFTPWNVKGGNYGSYTTYGASLTVITGATSTIPNGGKGNSPYDRNFNIISLNEPIQLVIPENINWNNIYFHFRVPQTGTSTTSTGVDSTVSSSGFILWTFASSGASLFASGEVNIFRGSDINQNSQISSLVGTTNSGSSSTFLNFYQSNYVGINGAQCAGFKCTLKLSLMKPVKLTDGREMPFLEYKISGFSTNIPTQYMELTAEGYSYGFLRKRQIQFPQITTNTALDFAVLQ